MRDFPASCMSLYYSVCNYDRMSKRCQTTAVDIKKCTALYIHVSTEEQAKHGYSLNEQERDLRQYAEQHGLMMLNLYY